MNILKQFSSHDLANEVMKRFNELLFRLDMKNEEFITESVLQLQSEDGWNDDHAETLCLFFDCMLKEPKRHYPVITIEDRKAQWYDENAPIGKKLGYPDCCIQEFCDQPPSVLKLQLTPDVKDQMRYDAACIDGKYSGFIPCEIHAMEIMTGQITLESLIKDRDPELPSFPDAFQITDALIDLHGITPEYAEMLNAEQNLERRDHVLKMAQENCKCEDCTHYRLSGGFLP